MCVNYNSEDPHGRKGRKGTKTIGHDNLSNQGLDKAKISKEKDDLEAVNRALAEKKAANTLGDAKDGGDGRDGLGAGDGSSGKIGDGSSDRDGDGIDGDDKNHLRSEEDDKDTKDDASKKKQSQTGPLVPDTALGKTPYNMV